LPAWLGLPSDHQNLPTPQMNGRRKRRRRVVNRHLAARSGHVGAEAEAVRDCRYSLKVRRLRVSNCINCRTPHNALPIGLSGRSADRKGYESCPSDSQFLHDDLRVSKRSGTLTPGQPLGHSQEKAGPAGRAPIELRDQQDCASEPRIFHRPSQFRAVETSSPGTLK
jgi:hypothetical protein